MGSPLDWSHELDVSNVIYFYYFLGKWNVKLMINLTMGAAEIDQFTDLFSSGLGWAR